MKKNLVRVSKYVYEYDVMRNGDYIDIDIYTWNTKNMAKRNFILQKRINPPGSWLILGGFVVLTIYIIYVTFSKPSISEKITVPPTSIPATPTVTISPSTQSDIPTSWQVYKSGDSIANAGFVMNYPLGWKVNMKKETKIYQGYTANFRIDFDLLPPGKQVNQESQGWMGWGELSIDVYNQKADIDQWIHGYLPEYEKDIVVSSTKRIGNKMAYELTAKSTAPFSIGWIPRYIILGSSYSYELQFSQNGEDGFNTRIENELYPTLNFN